MQAMLTPDEILLRRFGHVRAVGGAAYLVAVVVLFAIFGSQIWPLALGVPVLALATTAYFVKSQQAPRTSVAVSLLADALVLGGAIAFVGGTGSGLIMIYGIVVVSAGILLGPIPALSYTVLCGLLAGFQLLLEELGFTPVLLHRPDLADRVPMLLMSVAGVASIGYLTATYASRLHELIAEAGAQAEVVRRRGKRHRQFVQHAAEDVRGPLRDLEALADELEEGVELGRAERAALASRLRMDVTRLDGEIGALSDLGALDPTGQSPLVPVNLERVTQDCLRAMGERLAAHQLRVDVEPVKVVGNRRHARRVLLSLLDNVATHTPAGTTVEVRTLVTAGYGVLVVTDDGPGVPAEIATRLFDPPPGDHGATRLGLSLAAELCASMGATCRHERPADGGARFLVAFRLAPSAAPSPDDADLEPADAERPLRP